MHNPACSFHPVLWFRYTTAFLVATALLISCIVCSPVFAAHVANESTAPGADTYFPSVPGGGHPLMHFTPEQMEEIRVHYETAPRFNVSLRQQGIDMGPPAASKDLLPYLEYTPSERNQGWCGNCWVWASTGALEIENNVKHGIRDRLSIQYFNSKYHNGAGSDWACCGGWLGQFTSFSTSDGKTIPWSNTNANYGDYYSYCEKYITSIPAASITTEPSYTISSISDSTIETRGIGQAAAISNIKSALNSNKPVWYAFYYGTNGWNDFQNAWVNLDESSVFDPTPYSDVENAGGHAVLIVGYDDTDPQNPYWVVLNSWGSNTHRPNGLFRVNMSMDYDTVIYSGGYPFPQHMFSVLDADVLPTPPLPVNFTADITSGSIPLAVQFTDQSDVIDPLEYDWDFGDGSRSGSQNPRHEYLARGIYSVTLNVTNSTEEYSLTRQNYITVTLPRPVPEFSASPVSGPAPLTVSFTDDSLTNPATWAWFFGDEDYAEPWTEVNTNPGWTNRYGQSSVVLPDGSIVVTGGYDGSSKLDDVWRSTDNGTTWTLMTAHAGWTPRLFHTAVAMSDGSIILLGGNDIHDESGYRNDVWRSTDHGATWEEVTPGAAWPGRAAHSSVVLADDSIVVMGGNNGFGGGRLNDVWRSTDYGATWTPMTENAGWSPRWAQSVTAMPDGSIILTAGWNNIYQTDVWRSTDNGAAWTEVNSTLGGIQRGFHSTAALPDNSILLMGGVNDAGGRNDVWRSTDGGTTWTLLTDNAAWSDRYYQNSVTMPDGRIVMIGHTVPGGPNDVWQFNPAGSQDQNPLHTYTVPGTYTVALQVMNTSGINSTRKSGYMIISTPEPAFDVNFTADIQEGDAPLTVSFTDESTGDPTGWAWYFGDENYSQPWTEMTPAASWPARSSSASVVLPDGSILLMGGADDLTMMNDTWQSTDHGSTWTLVNASSGWTQRNGHSSVVLPDGSILLTGGHGYGGYMNDTWRSTDGGRTWIAMNVSPGWIARSGHSMVVLPDGRIILTGGRGDVDNRFLNDVWLSENYGATWTLVNGNPGWQPRAFHTSARIPDGSIVLMGGLAGTGSGVVMNDVWRSSDGGSTWNPVNSSAWGSGKTYHTSVVMPDGSILLMAGAGSSWAPDLWQSADYGATWTLVNTNPGWTARGFSSGAILPDGSIVLMGGDTITGSRNDVWRLQTAGSTEQNPSHTYTIPGNHTVALQVNNTAGYNSTRKVGYITVTAPASPLIANFTTDTRTGSAPLTVLFTDKSIGDPTGWVWSFGDADYTGSWQQVNENAAWLPRDHQSGVVMPDGSIVLMGGYNGNSDYWNDVWRSTDNGTTWIQMTANAGWSGRIMHTSAALPDGSIVLMGGEESVSNSNTNDVWRSMDNGATWLLVNASAGWSARRSPSSVVMPDGSIVLMGGFDNYGMKNDVWRSADAGATWTLVNASAGWPARMFHTSTVLPDGSIILLGGLSGSSSLNDVWRSTDYGATWMQMNSNAAWSVRKMPACAAMPDGTIILTGGGDAILINDVWKSDDNGATWTLVNTDPGWSPRYSHTMVVLPDSRIILMGGFSDDFRNDVWQLVINGSSEQNPSHTYTMPGTYTVALQVTNAGGYNSTRKEGYITVTSPATSDMVGVFRLSANQFILRPADYPSSPSVKFSWGKYSSDLPVTGDWDGDGITDVGVYRPSANQFILRPADYPTSPSVKIGWGKYSSDLPVTGDWNGDGITDVGVYRPSANQFILRPADYPTSPAVKIGWGKYSSDLPVTGTWS